MKKLHSEGFSVVELFIIVCVVAVIAVVGVMTFQKKDDKQSATNSNQTEKSSQAGNNTSSSSEADIELQNLGLADFSGIDYTKNAVRDYSSKGLKGFYVFGDKLEGNRQNPNFEYSSIRPGTKIVSAINGIVAFIKEQPESKDYEVFIQPKENSAWTVGYDHIKNVSVTKGASIKAGDPIGEAATQNNGLLRFEIQINKDVAGKTTHICPTTLLASSVKDKWLTELTNMQAKWESTTGLDLYEVAAQKPVGCIKTTLTPNEAEGR